MEFPSLGVRCSVSACKQLDFLAFSCSHCKLIFCKEHFHVSAHSCLKFQDNIVESPESVSDYYCSDSSCNNHSPVEIPCVKCCLHFCIAHRHHGCLDISEEQKSKELEKWNKPRQEFDEAKATVDKQISNSLRKAKNSTVAVKVQLMRLKGRAVGFNGIPTDERRYFLVYPPITGSLKHTGGPKAVFTCLRWSLGRTIDAFTDALSVPNTNNLSKSQKLKLFHQNTGYALSERMDILISDLLSSASLIDGESLILEYSDGLKVDESMYR
ncbi:AN1-type zinc finger protein 1 [Neodiprion pinetum]|uniref:AN1-type zinc finger protein 1 n=1 Tax=Neodiprion pinetum TaxID=441929 RepID=UPI001EE010A0|nr:AN1-type zinc finger protein 1-like [Neodiprion pinetum]